MKGATINKQMVSLALAASMVFATASCGAASGSAKGLASLTRGDVDADFDRVLSPKDALSESDLVIKGQIVDVEPGLTIEGKNPQLKQRTSSMYATFVVKIQEVADPDADAHPGDVVYVNLLTEAGPGRLSRANPDAAVALLLYTLPKEPVPGGHFARPSNIPGDATLYGALPDGVWLQGRKDSAMFGVLTEREELSAAWSQPQTVDDYIERIKQAQ